MKPDLQPTPSMDEREAQKVKTNFGVHINNPDESTAIAAMKTLLQLIKDSQATTMAGLHKELENAIEALKLCEASFTSIASGSELFMRFISNIKDERRDGQFEDLRSLMLERGTRFLKKVESSRKKIAKITLPHIMENSKILIHSKSRVVLEVLRQASLSGKEMTVYVTEARPDCQGKKMKEALDELGIDCVLILDSSVGYTMEKIDQVILGAEGVMASGGIINKIGSYTIALAAKAHNKPVHVVAESFKFSSLFPLNQQDVPHEYKFGYGKEKQLNEPPCAPPEARDPLVDYTPPEAQDPMVDYTPPEARDPLVDYTPPSYLDLLFTDIGILTPSAVSDELIKLSS